MADGPSAPATTVEIGALDGEIAAAEEIFVPATDEGLLRGDGAFEVIRVYDGKPFALGEHLDRLARSAASLRLPEPPRAALEAEIAELVLVRGGPDFDGCLRLVLTRGGRRLLLTEPKPEQPAAARLATITYAPNRVLNGVKSLSYAGNMLATRLAHERGFDEALLVTPHGRVLEAPTSSIFWVAPDATVCTPPLDDGILASITRDRVMRLADARERPCTLEGLRCASEAFLASTTRELQPVSAVDEMELPLGTRTLELRDALLASIAEELERS